MVKIRHPRHRISQAKFSFREAVFGFGRGYPPVAYSICNSQRRRLCRSGHPATRATKALTRRVCSLSHHSFRSKQWRVLSITGRTPCCPPASTYDAIRIPSPVPRRISAPLPAHPRAAPSLLFSRPMPCIFPTAGFEPLLARRLSSAPPPPPLSSHSSLVTGPFGTRTRRRLRTSRDTRPTCS